MSSTLTSGPCLITNRGRLAPAAFMKCNEIPFSPLFLVSGEVSVGRSFVYLVNLKLASVWHISHFPCSLFFGTRTRMSLEHRAGLGVEA